MEKELTYEYFFKDMSACPATEFFKKDEYVWQAIKNLKNLSIDRPEILGNVHKSAVLTGPIKIGKNSEIGPNVVIEGPVVIGENVSVRPGAYIRPNSVLGSNISIGHAVELKNSIIFDFAKISSHAFVGDSIIGKGARVATGSVTGNRRFDQKPVCINFNDKKIETGIEKFGLVLGDFSRLGLTVTTSPGTLAGPHCWVYSGSSISGFIKEKTLVKLRSTFEYVEKGENDLEFRDSEGKI